MAKQISKQFKGKPLPPNPAISQLCEIAQDYEAIIYSGSGIFVLFTYDGHCAEGYRAARVDL